MNFFILPILLFLLSAASVPTFASKSSPLNPKMLGSYQLIKAISGDCFSKISVEEDDGQYLDFSIFGSEPGEIVHQFSHVNQGQQTWPVLNPINGRSVGSQSTIAVIKGNQILAKTTSVDAIGALEFEDRFSGNFENDQLRLKVVQINRINPFPSGSSMNSYECVYQKK